MKKKLSMIGWIAAYSGIYLGIQMIVSMLYGIFYTLVNFRKFQDGSLVTELSDSIMGSIYIITAIAAIISVAVYYLIFMARKKKLTKECKLKMISVKSIIEIVIVTIGLSLLSNIFVEKFAKYFDSYDQIAESLANPNNVILSLICVIILVPIVEEILFRGLIFNELKRNMNIYLAIIIQGILFGLFHMNIIQGIYATFLGIAMGFMYYYTDSLISTIICHIVYNFFGTVVEFNMNGNMIYVYSILACIAIVVCMIFMRLDFMKNRKIIGENLNDIN